MNFSRVDPHAAAAGDAIESLAAQMVLPLSGFASSVVFLNYRLEQMVARGSVRQTDLDEMRRVLDLRAAGEPKDAP